MQWKKSFSKLSTIIVFLRKFLISFIKCYEYSNSNISDYQKNYLSINNHVRLVGWVLWLINPSGLFNISHFKYNINNSIQFNSFICMKWKSSKYCYVIPSSSARIFLTLSQYTSLSSISSSRSSRLHPVSAQSCCM